MHGVVAVRNSEPRRAPRQTEHEAEGVSRMAGAPKFAETSTCRSQCRVHAMSQSYLHVIHLCLSDCSSTGLRLLLPPALAGCHVTSRVVTSRHVTSRRVASRRVASRLVSCRLVSSRLFLSLSLSRSLSLSMSRSLSHTTASLHCAAQ